VVDPVIFHIENELHDVVCERILNESWRVFCDCQHEIVFHFLIRTCRGQTFLHDAAAVFVACNLNVMLDHRIVNELFFGLCPGAKNFLKDVISINVSRQIWNVFGQE
jgi:hypothetical protein